MRLDAFNAFNAVSLQRPSDAAQLNSPTDLTIRNPRVRGRGGDTTSRPVRPGTCSIRTG